MKVFYRPEQIAANQQSSSPSAWKPQLVIDDWLTRGIIHTGDIHRFEPVSRADFERVHHGQMVDDILDWKRCNGFGNRDQAVAAALS